MSNEFFQVQGLGFVNNPNNQISHNLDENQQKFVKAAVQKAQSIAMKFQPPDENVNIKSSSHSPCIPTIIGKSAPITTSNETLKLPLDMRKKRQILRQKRISEGNVLSIEACRLIFKERLRKALLKNFEYIARKDEKILEQQLAELEQTKCDQIKGDEFHQYSLDARKRKNENNYYGNVAVSGIGTSQRRKQQKKELKSFKHINNASNKHNGQNKSLYIAGLKIGERNSEQIEKDLHEIFSSYGPIFRIKLYRDHTKKPNCNLKGDGLITFSTHYDSDEQGEKNSGKPDDQKNNPSRPDVDLDMISLQLNGAELPCGSVLQVQPASFKSNSTAAYTNHKSNTGIKSSEKKAEEDNMQKITNDGTSKQTEEEEDQDLDDFFDSL